MTESVVLGLLGGAAGLLIATPTSAAMLAWIPQKSRHSPTPWTCR